MLYGEWGLFFPVSIIRFILMYCPRLVKSSQLVKLETNLYNEEMRKCNRTFEWHLINSLLPKHT